VSAERPSLPLLVRISSALLQQAGRTRLLIEAGRFIAVIDRRIDAFWASFAVPDPGQWKAGPLDAHAFLPALGETFAHNGRSFVSSSSRICGPVLQRSSSARASLGQGGSPS
jgi:hypothetical protein